MGTETVDYAAILADAEAKKAALEAYIMSLKIALAAGALGRSGDVVVQPGTGSLSITGQPVELPTGALLGKSVPAAIKLYLSSVRKKQTTGQIAVALKEGGVETTASNFETVVAGALFRLKHSGDVLRFPDGWGWSEFYPDHIRKAVSQDNTVARKKPKKASKIKVKTKAAATATKNTSSVVVPLTKGVEQRIVTLLQGGKALEPEEIAKSLDLNATGVKLTLGRMRAQRKVEKCEGGKFKLAS